MIGRLAAVALGCSLALSACGDSGPVILQLGTPCTPGDTEAVCADGTCLSLDSQSGFCTRPCNEDCPPDYSCEAAGRFGRVCIPLTGCKEEVDCPAGHTCNQATGHCYIAVSRGLCSPCQDVAQCPSGGACFKAVGSSEQFCTSACQSNDDCPLSFTCREIPSGPEGALQKQCVPTTESCNAGRPLCAPCTGDDECGGPLDRCVRNVVSQEQFCGRDCNPSRNLCPTLGCVPETLDSAENPDCPTGFSCVNLAQNSNGNRGPYQCVPNSNSCEKYCGAISEVGQISECGIGQVCRNNVCQPASDGRVCSPCTDNDDCRDGDFPENRCLVNNCPDCPYRGESFCSTPCANDDACVRSFGFGFVCKPVDDPSGVMRKYCMPQRGTCQTGLKRLGEDCQGQGAADCLSGMCLVAGFTSFCSNACTTDAQCVDGRFRCCEVVDNAYDCSAEHRDAAGPKSGTGVCAPTGGLFGDDCTPGRPPCQSGVCLDLGTARVCTVSCSGSSCPSGFACRKAASAEDMIDVCFPVGGGKPGGDCSFGPAACESGLCIRKSSGNECTTLCTSASDCPTDWSCELTRSVTEQSVQACIPPALLNQ